MAQRNIPLGLVLLFASGLGLPAARAADVTRPNIIVILADDLGYGDLGCYNADSKIPTPNLDMLARDGMRFTDAHSPSAVCTPTRYGLLTGRYPWRTRLKKGVIGPWGSPLIEADRLTLPAMLRRQGYATACIGKWHLGWTWPTTDGQAASSRTNKLSNVDFHKPITDGPTTRGFDLYFGTDVPNYPPYCYIENDRTVGIPSTPSGPDFNVPGPMLPGWKWVDVLPGLSRRAVQYVEDAAKATPARPFFLYLPLTSPHFPVVPTPEFQGKSQAGTYGDFVMQTDTVVGDVLKALDRTGLAKNTLVVFTSDNGPEIAGEIGISAFERLKQFGHSSMGPLRGVKRDAWEGGHRVPFIVRWPGQVKPATVTDQLAAHTDLMATIAAVVGVSLPDDAAEDSTNLLPALRGEKVQREGVILAGSGGKLAIRLGEWVLIDASTGLENTGPRAEPAWFKDLRGYKPHDQPYELFNLREDLAQRTNLAASEPRRVQAILALRDKYQREGRSVPRRNAGPGR